MDVVVILFAAAVGAFLVYLALAGIGGTAVAALNLAGLMTMSYGWVNIPVGPLPVPVADILVLYSVAATRRQWIPLVRTRGSAYRRFVMVWSALACFVLGRLVFDVPRFGITAVRDALYVPEFLAFLTAASLMAAAKRRTWLLPGFMYAVLICSAGLYPFRQSLIAISPHVGIQYDVPLLDWTVAGVSAAACFFYFVYRPGLLGAGAAAVAVLGLLLVQQKGVYLAFALSGLAMLFLHLRQQQRTFQSDLSGAPGSRLLFRLAASVGIGLALIGTLPLSGRLENASPQFLADQIHVLFGQDSSSGSVVQREAWIPLVTQAVAQAPLGELVGAGFGPDLTGGFTSPSGALVRKPHDDYLEAYGRLGLVGGALFLAVLLVVLTPLARVRRVDATTALLGAAVLCNGVVAATQPHFAFAYGTVPFAVAGGALAWLTRPGSDLPVHGATGGESGMAWHEPSSGPTGLPTPQPGRGREG